jgi:heat shock protein HtpX
LITLPILFFSFEVILIIILSQCLLFFSGFLWYWFGGQIVLRLNNIEFLENSDSVYLREYIQQIEKKIGLKSNIKIGVLNSALPNAFTIFSKPHKYIIVFSVGIFENLDQTETQAVLAHEISHIKNKDIWLKSLFIIGRYIWFPFGPILESYVSRNREFRADEKSVKITNNPLALASALIKMTKCYQMHRDQKFKVSNLGKSFLILSPTYKSFKRNLKKIYYRHPLIEERVRRLMKFDSGKSCSTKKKIATRNEFI